MNWAKQWEIKNGCHKRASRYLGLSCGSLQSPEGWGSWGVPIPHSRMTRGRGTRKAWGKAEAYSLLEQNNNSTIKVILYGSVIYLGFLSQLLWKSLHPLYQLYWDTSHIIQFTYLKYMIHCVLLYAQCCPTSATNCPHFKLNFYFEKIVNSCIVVRNNTKRSFVHFTQFPLNSSIP